MDAWNVSGQTEMCQLCARTTSQLITHFTNAFDSVSGSYDSFLRSILCGSLAQLVATLVGSISYSTPGPVSTGMVDRIGVQLPQREIYLNLTNHPGQLSLAIPSWVGAMSTLR